MAGPATRTDVRTRRAARHTWGMDAHDRLLRALIASAVEAQPDLAADLCERCWPGHGAERSQPLAAQWLRRWGPARGYAVTRACSCAAGRCATCN